MATKRDPEGSKMAKEQEKQEISKVRKEIDQYLKRIPARVVNGSHNEAVSFKEAVKKAQKAVYSTRSNLHKLRECAGELARFYT